SAAQLGVGAVARDAHVSLLDPELDRDLGVGAVLEVEDHHVLLERVACALQEAGEVIGLLAAQEGGEAIVPGRSRPSRRRSPAARPRRGGRAAEEREGGEKDERAREHGPDRLRTKHAARAPAIAIQAPPPGVSPPIQQAQAPPGWTRGSRERLSLETIAGEA